MILEFNVKIILHSKMSIFFHLNSNYILHRFMQVGHKNSTTLNIFEPLKQHQQ